MELEKLSRRSFILGSAALASGAAAAALTGCTPGQDKDAGSRGAETAWDKRADIVVIGSGTGAVAAFAAPYFGAASVILIEKLDSFGGTAAISGGGFGLPLSRAAKEMGVEDNIDDVITYYQSASGGRADVDVVKSYVENGNKFLDWTEKEFGFKWGFGPNKMYQDYYDPCPGYRGFGRGNLSVSEIGGEKSQGAAGLWNFFQRKITENGNAEVLLGTQAVDLVVDAGGGVVGVLAKKGNEQIAIGADKGVIVATGGFEHNDEMRKKHLAYPLLSASSQSSNTGDGHLMGAKIGAELIGMDRAWGLPSFLLGGEDPFGMLENNRLIQNFNGQDPTRIRGLPGTIVVNREGERIGNESAAYDVFNRAFGVFDTDSSSFKNLPAYFICDSSYVGTYTLPGQKTLEDPVPEIFVSADSLDELAEKLGIDVAGLVAEVTGFNEHARVGQDPKFGRGSHDFDINTPGEWGGKRTDIPNMCLSPLETPPFYGSYCVPGSHGTCGGLRIDPNGQVVSLSGKPIPRLYAAGNCSSGVSGHAYCHGGMTVGSGSVMGWAAVRHALGYTE